MAFCSKDFRPELRPLFFVILLFYSWLGNPEETESFAPHRRFTTAQRQLRGSFHGQAEVSRRVCEPAAPAQRRRTCPGSIPAAPLAAAGAARAGSARRFRFIFSIFSLASGGQPSLASAGPAGRTSGPGRGCGGAGASPEPVPVRPAPPAAPRLSRTLPATTNREATRQQSHPGALSQSSEWKTQSGGLKAESPGWPGSGGPSPRALTPGSGPRRGCRGVGAFLLSRSHAAVPPSGRGDALVASPALTLSASLDVPPSAAWGAPGGGCCGLGTEQHLHPRAVAAGSAGGDRQHDIPGGCILSLWLSGILTNLVAQARQ